MPAKKVNNVSDVIWGNKAVESNARLLPPSRGPLTTDPEWNEMVDVLQDLSIGHQHDGVDSRAIAKLLGSQDSQSASPVAGDLILANSSTPPAWSRLAKGTASQYLGTPGIGLPRWQQITFSQIGGTLLQSQFIHGHTPNLQGASFFAVGTTTADFTTTSTTDVVVTGLSISMTGRNANQGLRAFVGFIGGVKVSGGTGGLSIYVDGGLYFEGPISHTNLQLTTVYVPEENFDAVSHTFDVRVRAAAGQSITVSGTSFTSALFGFDLGTATNIP